jgi:plasmid maintenance system antidote protein VapI
MSKSSTATKGMGTPNRMTTHPGEMLSEEFLGPLGMSVNVLAMALRLRPPASAPSCRASAR